MKKIIALKKFNKEKNILQIEIRLKKEKCNFKFNDYNIILFLLYFFALLLIKLNIIKTIFAI